ncbi:hypothetical protein [Oryzifoliimicrobium ureilyticus]|uniref:hypothetical protein n=1 Tax=Oryzifoliimicrobium ureilyticus TaxID=3113724 RepID=UPI0030766A40
MDMADDDRIATCKDALGQSFRSFFHQSIASGWSEEEVALALVELAEAQVARLMTNAMLDAEAQMQLISPGSRLKM